jgi:hypothetical protein
MEPKAIKQLEVLGQMNITVASSGIEPKTFELVA